MITRWLGAGALGLALSASAAQSGAAPVRTGIRTVPVYVDRARLETEGLMLTELGRTALPMRALFEALGARVEWDPRERSVYAWKEDGSGVRFGVGERRAQVLRMAREPAPGEWGEVVGNRTLDAPAVLYAGKVYVPIRAASEILNARVAWNPAAPAVHIRTTDASRAEVAGSREERERPGPADREAREREAREREARREEERELRAQRARLARALDVSLLVPRRRFRENGEVPMQLVVINRSEETVTVHFRSGQRYDFEVLQNNQLVWNWAHDRAFTLAITALTLKPGERLSFETRWDMMTNAGRPVDRGVYTLRGRLTVAASPQGLTDEKIVEVVR